MFAERSPELRKTVAGRAVRISVAEPRESHDFSALFSMLNTLVQPRNALASLAAVGSTTKSSLVTGGEMAHFLICPPRAMAPAVALTDPPAASLRLPPSQTPLATGDRVARPPFVPRR